MIAALGRVAPQHTYLVTGAPPGIDLQNVSGPFLTDNNFGSACALWLGEPGRREVAMRMLASAPHTNAAALTRGDP